MYAVCSPHHRSTRTGAGHGSLETAAQSVTRYHPLPRAEIRRRLDDAAASYETVARQLGVAPDDAEAAIHAALNAASPFPS